MLDDIAAGGPLTSGFFPLESASGSKLCNLEPYWVHAGGSCIADQYDWLNDRWQTNIQGVERNFYFTTEARVLFAYTGGETVTFFGDDDAWVFINGQLALDLGGTHERIEGSVALQEGGDSRFGLQPGNLYELAIFHAQRHPRESNYQLTLSGFTKERSVCTPTCGDAVVTATEECDNGAANDDSLYGGCTTECRYGPFCGDGVVQAAAGEACDLGHALNRDVAYGVTGCTPACALPPRCGDGVVQPEYEECDDGNETDQDGCSAACLSEP